MAAAAAAPPPEVTGGTMVAGIPNTGTGIGTGICCCVLEGPASVFIIQIRNTRYV